MYKPKKTFHLIFNSKVLYCRNMALNVHNFSNEIICIDILKYCSSIYLNSVEFVGQHLIAQFERFIVGMFI